jgi:hypothetical protein
MLDILKMILVMIPVPQKDTKALLGVSTDEDDDYNNTDNRRKM